MSFLKRIEAAGKIKCPECGMSVPDVPEDATYEETLCNQCYEKWNKQCENKHCVHILWGSHPEKTEKPVLYSFDSKKELDAFLKGVEESSGWADYKIIEPK